MANMSKKTILFVEDDITFRRIIQEILEQEGYRVLLASGGRDALDACDGHNGPIDLLLADVALPIMPGGELARRLVNRYSDLKILYISGHPRDALEIQSTMKGSAIKFLQKPFTTEDLLRQLHEVIDVPRPAIGDAE